VLVNLMHQEKIGLTDTISAVVGAILKHGPLKATPEVTAILHGAGRRETPAQRRIRQTVNEEQSNSSKLNR